MMIDLQELEDRMFAQYTQDVALSHNRFSSHYRLTAVSLLCGLLLGFLFAWVLAMPLSLVGLAPWLLGQAISFVATTLLQAHAQREASWGMAIVGQLLGVVAIGLFFWSLIS